MAASCNRAVATQAVAASVAAVAKAAANSGHAVVVPEAMHLKESLKEADFQKYSVRLQWIVRVGRVILDWGDWLLLFL